MLTDITCIALTSICLLLFFLLVYYFLLLVPGAVTFCLLTSIYCAWRTN